MFDDTLRRLKDRWLAPLARLAGPDSAWVRSWGATLVAAVMNTAGVLVGSLVLHPPV